MLPNGFKRGRDMCVDYLQFPTGCTADEPCDTVSATLSFLRMSLDDLVQQLRARKTCTVEIKRYAAERRHGVLAKYLLIVDGDDRYLVRYGHAFGGTSRKHLVSHVVVDRENAARLGEGTDELAQTRLPRHFICGLFRMLQDMDVLAMKPHDFLKCLSPVGAPRYGMEARDVRISGTIQRKEFLCRDLGGLDRIMFHAMAACRRLRIAVKVDKREFPEQTGRIDVLSGSRFDDNAARLPERDEFPQLRLRGAIRRLNAPSMILGISANAMQTFVDRRLAGRKRSDEKYRVHAKQCIIISAQSALIFLRNRFLTCRDTCYNENRLCESETEDVPMNKRKRTT